MTARDAAAERALLVLDLVVGGLSREGAETKVTAFEQAYRAELAEEFAAFAERHVTQAGHCAGCDMALVLAAELRRMAAPTTTQEQP